ncbi:uncharacterized protein LOC134713850 [Mytilus trossulus]|uniref:uncharacterized protein LOC134713850 n=1 Tax=Mytilus trossulus TaxID=6551 RepID=UPI003007BA30
MPKRDRKSEEDWEKVKAVVNKMLDRGDTIVSIMINKDSKTVEFCGPDHMKGFGQRIANDFVQAATKIEVCAPSINLGVATMDIDNANTHNIRKVMADIVNTDGKF